LIFSFSNERQPISSALSIGFIEVTNGVKKLSLINQLNLTVPLACALISFGGISIIMQSLIYLQKAEVKTFTFILGKLLQTIIAFIICFIFTYFLL
jgi:hypothetical protein